MKFLTAGESHGPKLTTIVDGYPGGVELDPSFFSKELKRRKVGYGRGKRMEIENDTIRFTGGVRFGMTTGAPISLEIENTDFVNWTDVMSPFASFTESRSIVKPRPGHADLAGMLKYNRKDIRDVLERASARETASRVAVGALCKTFLRMFGINVYSVVWEIGGTGLQWEIGLKSLSEKKSDVAVLAKTAETNDLRIPLKNLNNVYKRIDRAREEGDSLGGVFTVAARGIVPGIGSYSQYDARLDGVVGGLLMSIPAVKAVSSGSGFLGSDAGGIDYHDGIYFDKKKGVSRKTNRAGGIEGGMTNGEDIFFTCFMKPIPTLLSPLPSVDLKKMRQDKAVYERSDVTAVSACSVVAEAMLSIGITNAFLCKFGCDSLAEIQRNYSSYRASISHIWKKSF